MPRQAARLVLGRSARVPPTTRLRPFSTTPRRRDDDASKPPTRRERSVAAASALGAMSRPSQPSQRSQGPSSSSERKPAGARNPANLPHTATLGSRLGANVISMRSLPKRDAGASRPLIRRVSHEQEGGQRPRSGPPGANIVGGRFKPGTNGPRFARPPGFQGGQGSGPGSRLRATLGGGGKRMPPKRAGGFKKKKRSDEDKKKDKEASSSSGMKSLDEEVQAYVREQQVGGPERAYKPSVTLESLVGWGPAVATNTALGQADLAFRSVKVLGGGRGAGDEEQSFKIDEVKKWLVANKPIYFSNVEQKKAVIQTLAHEKRDKMVQKYKDAIVKEIQQKNGNNWGAFVESLKAWAAQFASTDKGKKLGESLIKANARPEDWLKVAAEARADAQLEDMARKYKTQNTKTTREAILKYVLKGEHPEVKYAEDVYGKLATYHAQGSTYTAADGAKFDEKIRKLIKMPPAGKAAPRAQAKA
ncbi:hypothetical protein N8I77_011756 [Diaporthe amygdali]|uniref:Uncharacterized protein n=1 Tax=Phomopsis amygdali TaxID=1214568 RepID=A0AAD9W002_PHOAM|nr:hypothetical protein N8I77_011756 [Diaporthe amygdali]